MEKRNKLREGEDFPKENQQAMNFTRCWQPFFDSVSWFIKILKNKHTKSAKTNKELTKEKSICQIFYKSLISLKKSILDYCSLHPECILKVELYANSIVACDTIRDSVEKLEKEGYKVQLVIWLSETVFLNSNSEADLALNQLIDQLILQKEL